jgi:hypothetical protein
MAGHRFRRISQLAFSGSHRNRRRVHPGPADGVYADEVHQLKVCVCVLMLAASVGCSRVPPLAHAHPSASSLAAAVLDALGRRDRGTLEALALSEGEFRDHVWPQLPAARPERNLPFSYVWGDHRQKSAAALTSVLSREGGMRYELIDVRFEGETDYGTYRVHRDATLRVRDAGGVETDLRVCGSMLQHDGAWKVFSYIVND